MSESKHTPGPLVVSGTLTKGRHAIDGDGTHRVPVAVTEWQDGGVSEANARLIAAAPDMLAALREAHEFAGDIVGFTASRVWKKLDAAIAKAEGR